VEGFAPSPTQNSLGSKNLEKASMGATMHLPQVTSIMREDFCQTIKNLWLDYPKRKEMNRSCYDLISPGGAIKVAEQIIRLVK
jgi:hypothetical protein